jgi:hypothetical protein
MGSMSASDAAPLPRLGEVFFDVRGNSRSMRLSWYADTGVAVFSIWQGGTCTGTFRLPMDDLERMIEALRRGPQGKGQRASRDVQRDAQAVRDAVPGGGGQDQGQPTQAMRMPERAGRDQDGARSYRRDSAGYPDPLSPDYPAEQLEDYRTGAGTGDFRPAADAGYPDVPVTGDYRRTGAEPAAYPEEASSGSYRRPGRSGGYPAEPGYPAGADYPDDYRGGSSGSHRRDAGRDPARDAGGYPADYRSGSSGSHRRDAPGYPVDPAYPADPGYSGYSRQPDIADYHDEPPTGGSGAYPADPDYGQHGTDWGEDTADQSVGSYGDEPPAESFPYSRRGGNREPRERGRYPGRH